MKTTNFDPMESPSVDNTDYKAKCDALLRQVAESRLESLRSQMDPHFIFNAITTIQHYILNNDKRVAIEYLEEFATLIRTFLDHSRAKTISVQEEIDLLVSYINLEAMRFGHKFGFSIEVSQSLALNAIQIPSMLVQPFVENAIKHGLMHKIDYGQLWVRIFEEGKSLVVEVEDNGIGRKRSAQINEWKKPHKPHKSHATAVSLERIALMNQLSPQMVSFDIYDREASDPSQTGTKVVFSFPLLQVSEDDF